MPWASASSSTAPATAKAPIRSGSARRRAVADQIGAIVVGILCTLGLCEVDYDADRLLVQQRELLGQLASGVAGGLAETADDDDLRRFGHQRQGVADGAERGA